MAGSLFLVVFHNYHFTSSLLFFSPLPTACGTITLSSFDISNLLHLTYCQRVEQIANKIVVELALEAKVINLASWLQRKMFGEFALSRN